LPHKRRFQFVMRRTFILGAPLALALLVGCVDAADSLQSGPQVGDKVGIFEPLNVTGPFEGKRQCLV
jgi:hypothetical protein